MPCCWALRILLWGDNRAELGCPLCAASQIGVTNITFRKDIPIRDLPPRKRVRLRPCGAGELSIFGIPILGRKMDAPEERRRMDEFQSDLRCFPVLLPKEIHGASYLLSGGGVDEEHLAAHLDICGQVKQTTVRIHPKRLGSLLDRPVSICGANDYRHRDVDAFGAALSRGDPAFRHFDR